MPTSVYVASRVRHAPMWRDYRHLGANIISSWIDEAGDGESTDLSLLWLRIQTEVANANRLVFYAEAEDFPFKGALVEVGIALQARIPVYLVLTPNIVLEPSTMRPLGSWACHPGVIRWHLDLETILAIEPGRS